MISRAVADLKHHLDQQEVEAAVNATKGVLNGFRHEVLPYVKTYPLTGFDAIQLELIIRDARTVMETLYGLIDARAKVGDGAAIMTLYRNLQAVVQCKLTLNKWRHGLTREVVDEGEAEMTRLIQVWVPVVRGLELMSDLSFSQGIFVYFEVGGKHGAPKFTKYAYAYRGELQGKNSKTALVSQAFIDARKVERSRVIPQELFEWNKKPYEVMQQLRDQENKIFATKDLHIESHGMDTYLVGNCLNNDQHWNQRTLRLDSCLGDNRGKWLIVLTLSGLTLLWQGTFNGVVASSLSMPGTSDSMPQKVQVKFPSWEVNWKMIMATF